MPRYAIYPFLAFLTLTIMPVPSVHADTDSSPMGTLSVMVVNEDGFINPDSHVYIFSEATKEFMGTEDVPGYSRFELPVGTYRVYAGMTLKNKDALDHFSSPEARLTVSAVEPTSVILTLRKSPNSELTLNDTARKSLGIDPELAKYLN